LRTPSGSRAQSTRVREGAQLKSIGNDAEGQGGTFDLASSGVSPDAITPGNS